MDKIRKLLFVYKEVFKMVINDIKGYYFVYTLLSVFFVFDTYIKLKFVSYVSSTIGNYKFDWSTIVVYLLIFLICFMCAFFQAKVYTLIKFRLVTGILSRKNEKMTKISWENFETSSNYSCIKTVDEKICNAYLFLADDLTKYVIIISYFVFYICQLFSYGILYMIFVLILLLISAFISVKNGKIHYDFWGKVFPSFRKSNYFMSLAGKRIFHEEKKINKTEEFIYMKWFSNRIKGIELQKEMDQEVFKNKFVSDVVYCLMITSLVLFVLLRTDINIEQFIFLLLLLVDINDRGEILFERLYDSAENIRYFKDYFNFLNMKIEKPISVENCKFEKIELKNISYKYPDSSKYAIRDVSMELKRGEKITIVGSNGSGKSTLVNLLLELTDNYTGEISYNGISNRSGLIKKNVSAILQDFGQYNFSLKENIELGWPEHHFTKDEIIGLGKITGIHDWIMDLPEGYETRLGQFSETGVGISKGQWQKIALARLLANPDSAIWILDEPTAYLDPIAEIDTYKYINDLSEDKLVIFITHRIGFAQFTDKIFYMEEGRVQEYGTHEELMKAEGKYYSMFCAEKKLYE